MSQTTVPRPQIKAVEQVKQVRCTHQWVPFRTMVVEIFPNGSPKTTVTLEVACPECRERRAL